MVGDRDLCRVYRLGRCSLAERIEIQRFVLDIGNVHIDETETDFLELGLDIVGHLLFEDLAFGIDLLDIHRGNRRTQLAEDNVFGQRFDLLLRFAE